jgi:Zn-finger nucleic acid-binding protein
MNCPGCTAAMTRLALEGRLGTTIEIDMCPVCRAIWFDSF